MNQIYNAIRTMPHHCLFVSLLVVASLSLQASASSGTAGFSKPPYTPSACYEDMDVGNMVVAVSDAIWDGGSACGAVYDVLCSSAVKDGKQTCQGGSVRVTVTDYCPVGCTATMMLSQESFFAITSEPSIGIIGISYQSA